VGHDQGVVFVEKLRVVGEVIHEQAVNFIVSRTESQ